MARLSPSNYSKSFLGVKLGSWLLLMTVFITITIFPWGGCSKKDNTYTPTPTVTPYY